MTVASRTRRTTLEEVLKSPWFAHASAESHKASAEHLHKFNRRRRRFQQIGRLAGNVAMAMKRTPTHLSQAIGMPPATRRALRRRFMAAVAATPADTERRPPFSVDRERFNMFTESVGLGGIAEEVNMFDMFDGNDDGYVSYVAHCSRCAGGVACVFDPAVAAVVAC